MMPYLAGAVLGFGLFLFAFALAPPRPGLARRLAAFDSAWEAADAGPPSAGLTGRVGAWLAARCAERGWRFPSIRANLALTGGSFEEYLATKCLLAIGGLALGPLASLVAGLAGLALPTEAPVWLGFTLALLFFFLPDLELREKATARRRDFRHAVGAFLDLVAMNLAGGRGVPEALVAAGEVGDGWAFGQIREALAGARITGLTPWQALGRLGEELGVDELRDLAAALGLVADDGAQVRQSLLARAASLRRRELADLAGQAGERSQSMLVAQMLMCAGFLVFLIYPAVGLLIGG